MSEEISVGSRLNDRRVLVTDRVGENVSTGACGRRETVGHECSPRGRGRLREIQHLSTPIEIGQGRQTGDQWAPSGRASTALDETWGSLLECTPDLVVVVSGEGLIWHINHMPAGQAGSRGSVIGSSIYDLLVPEYRAKLRESIEGVLRTGQMVRQVVFFTANGSGALCSEARMGPIVRNGRTVAVGMFFADITDYENLQARLGERERLLRSIVRAVPRMMDILEGLIRQGTTVAEPASRTYELDLCREQMIQIGRLASIGKASCGLTQRLPQFLTAIGISIENALVKLDIASHCEGARQELGAALQAISGLATGVAQLHGFSETSSRNPLIHAVDLEVSLANVVQLLGARARGANAIIRIGDHEGWPKVRMAEGDAEQLFFALIENLIRFADGKREHRIEVSSVVKGDCIELLFSGDGGLGAKEDSGLGSDSPLSADPAAQVADLGLCVAWDVVIRAGGTIRRESTADVGTAFFVKFPTVDRESSDWGGNGTKRKTTYSRRRG